MKKINLFSYLVAALFFAITSCSTEGDLLNNLDNQKSITQETICGESTVVSLIAGQHIDVGTVTVSNDETYLYVTYETSGDWYLTETHLYVGSEDGIPLNGAGNPKIGHFPYHGDHETVKSYTFDPIPLADLGDPFVVVAHAVVDKIINGDTMISEETAFGCGDKEFPGNRWGCYFEYEKQVCDEEECMDAFSYKPHPDFIVCFLDDGFDQWGWTSLATHRFFWRYRQDNGYNYQFPLVVKADDCNIANSINIGYVEIEATFEEADGTTNLFANVKYVITDSNYKISRANLFLGTDKYPKDGDGNYTVLPDEYNYSADNLSLSEFTFTKVDWPIDDKDAGVYLIPYAEVCLIKG